MPLDPNVTYQLTESGAETDALLDTIGTDALTTTAQTLTGAVNEVLGDVGDLSTLVTTDKSSVVSAVNEVAGDIRGRGLFQIVYYSYAYTINASSSLNISADDMGLSTPSGYKPIALTRFSSGNGNVCTRFADIEATGTSACLALRNVATSSISATSWIGILYVKVW